MICAPYQQASTFSQEALHLQRQVTIFNFVLKTPLLKFNLQYDYSNAICPFHHAELSKSVIGPVCEGYAPPCDSTDLFFGHWRRLATTT